MVILCCIFCGAVSLTLVFAGISKILSYSNTINTITKIGIFPKQITRIIGIFLPLFELISALFLILIKSKIIFLLLIGYLLFFIGLNLKYTIEKKEVKCCCYGKFIESKLGKAGLIHYLYLLLVLIISYSCKYVPITIMLKLYQVDITKILLIILNSILLMINGFIIRTMIEKFGFKEE